MSDIVSFILGLIAGLATNLGSWWILAHYIIPKIEFSDSISKLPATKNEYDRSGYRYRIKIRNSGRRSIIDVDLSATLRIEGLSKNGNTQVIRIPWTTDREYRLNIIRLIPIKPGIKASRVLRLYINSVDQFHTRSIYPEEFRKKAAEASLTLEDVLSLGTRAYLQINALGYDEFSGARKLYMSKFYSLADIKDGSFELASLSIATGVSTLPETTDENPEI